MFSQSSVASEGLDAINADLDKLNGHGGSKSKVFGLKIKFSSFVIKMVNFLSLGLISYLLGRLCSLLNALLLKTLDLSC